MEYGPIRINRSKMSAQIGGRPLSLTPKEFELLQLLVEKQGQLLSNEEIIARVWPNSARASASDVQQYIHHLRQKLKQEALNPDCIRNEKGFGYRLYCRECEREQLPPSQQERWLG